VIGGGHNGLVCACLLAREGFNVVLLERASRCGGCIVTEELGSGALVDLGALELAGILPLARDLKLAEVGLRFLRQSYLAIVHTHGGVIPLHHQLALALRDIETAAGPEAAARWRRFSRLSKRMAAALAVLSSHPPGQPLATTRALARLLPSVRALPELILGTAEGCASRRLGDERLVAATVAYGSHPQVPPWSPGSGYLATLLPGAHGRTPVRAAGGSGALVDALERRARQLGARISTESEVARILTRRGTVTGVALTNGQEVDADVVVSTIDVRRTSSLLDEPTVFGGLAGIHTGLFNVGELSIGTLLEAIPELPGPVEAGAALRLIVPRPYGEAFREMMAGMIPEPLPVLCALPSLADPARTPRGGVTGWISAFVPAKGETPWRLLRDRAVDAALATVELALPGFRDRLLDLRVLTPEDWEARTGNPAGNPNHLDLTLDQMLWMRPAPGLARYRTPLRGLYLSGAGTHPGGGVTGLPGLLAARAVIADHRRMSSPARRSR
jgi:phytoene dehydrogenase-like protein